MVDLVHRGGEAQHVGEQDELVAAVGAGGSGADQEVHGPLPLGFGGPGFPYEGVHVGDQATGQLAQPWVLALEGSEYLGQQLVELPVGEVVVIGFPPVGAC